MGLGKDVLKKSVGIGFVKDMKTASHAAAAGAEALRQKDQLLAQGAALRAADQAQMAGMHLDGMQMPGASVMPAVGAVTDAELEPIAGVSLEQYVTIAKASAGSAGNPEAVALIAFTHGVASRDWDSASAGWAARMQANRAVGQRFNELYMGA